MTHEQAQARAVALNEQLPNGASHHWIIHHEGGEQWRVVRIDIAGIHFAGGERHTVTESRPEPGPDQDPRPIINRLIPPWGPN